MKTNTANLSPGCGVALHLTMRDNIKIAIDVILPTAVPPEGVPTAMVATRYWRTTLDEPLKEASRAFQKQKAHAHGLALVLVDVRGTGASTGQWAWACSDSEIENLGEVVDWIAAQPWSDGTVGAYGTSYNGSTALLLTTTHRPAIKAVVPRFSMLDTYAHIGFPGGVPLDWFLFNWDLGNHLLDDPANAAKYNVPVLGRVRPVDGDTDGQLLAQAVTEHAGNLDMWGLMQTAVARDDLADVKGGNPEKYSPHVKLDAIKAANVPLWLWTGWFDGGYAASALGFLNMPGINARIIIGGWNHGAALPTLSSPYQPTAPIDYNPEQQLEDIYTFLEAHQRGTAVPPAPPLRYYTLGEEAWHEADQWPPAGVSLERWWLQPDYTLNSAPYDLKGSKAEVSYTVDRASTTGLLTRWHTLMGGFPVLYPDRAEKDRRNLIWESAPLGQDMEITGNVVVHLTIAATTIDASIFVYLEDVTPEGQVLYVTEGQLRAVHRAVSSEPGPYPTYGPRPTYLRQDMQDLVPGESAELNFTLNPISVLIRHGHRVRIAVAGADDKVFRQIPAEGEPPILTFYCGNTTDKDCWLDFPVQKGRQS